MTVNAARMTTDEPLLLGIKEELGDLRSALSPTGLQQGLWLEKGQVLRKRDHITLR